MRREELASAEGRTIPDVIGRGLRVLFCGINPGLWSAAVGQHFAHPSNRFWKVLHQAGFTDRLLAPAEQGELPGAGVGITNLGDARLAPARCVIVESTGGKIVGRNRHRAEVQ